MGAEGLQQKIEGAVSPQAVLGAIDWNESTNSLDQDRVKRTKGFVTKWIFQEKNLQDLLFTITGSYSLASWTETDPDGTLQQKGTRLKFELYDRAANLIPSAHTCFLSIELPINYPNYETFYSKLDLLLKQSTSTEHSGVEEM